MPSNIDKAFIENLQNFTDSLESIVEILKEQSKKGDAINQMLSTMDGPKLSDISKDMKAILESNKKIDDRTKQILEEIKASRKQKESGMFDKIEGKDNKRKIVDGVQTVILIAGGVLAIGMAFKLIGKVDFLSVVALSLGMVMVSYAFAKIAEIKNLTPQKSLMVGLALIIIAGAITVTSYILKSFVPLSVAQMLSFVVVSAGIGTGAYFIFKAVKDLKELKPTDVWKYLLLPVILPAIAMGIVLSSMVLKYIQPIGFGQAISAIFVGLALVVGSLAVYMVLKALKGKEGSIDIKGIGLALLLIPGIAAGIVVASLIFQLFQPLKANPFDVILSSLSMGLAIIFFLPAVWVLGKMSLKQVAIGTLGAVMVSAAIMLSSWILSVGNYKNYPDWKWALGTGLSLIMFLPAVLVLGFVAMTGAGALAILAGAGMTLVVAATIVGTSYILGLGKYDKYPTAAWAAGVGLSLILFVPAILVLGVLAMTGIGAVAILAGAALTLAVAATIVAVSYILGSGKYDKYPSASWAAGVGLSMILATGFMVVIGAIAMTGIGALAILAGIALTKKIAQTIVDLSFIFGIGKYGEYPPTDWSNGVGLSILKFSTLMVGLALLSIGIVVGAAVMLIVASSVVAVAYIFNSGKYDSYPPTEWANGVGLTILKFSAMMIALAIGTVPLLLGAGVTLIIAKSIVELSHILNKGIYSGGPTKEWLSGTGDSLLMFAKISQNDEMEVSRHNRKGLLTIAESMVEVADVLSKGNFTSGPNDSWTNQLVNMIDIFVNKVPDKNQLKKLQDFIEVIKDFGKAANRLRESGVDKLAKLTASVTIMSVIDDQKLQKVIGVLDNNKDKLSNVIEGKEMSRSESFKQKATEVIKSAFGGDEAAKDKQDVMIERFDTVIKKFDELLEFVISEQGPNNTGKNDSTK